MNGRSSIRLSRGFWYSLAAALLWSAIAYGVYMLYIGTVLQGVISLVTGTVIVVVLLGGRAMRALEQRRLPRANAHLLLFALATFSLLQLLFVFPLNPTRGIRAYFPLFHEIVLLGLVVLTIWQFARSRSPE
jgi:ABC-type xylose transport system permease subunit